MVVANSYEQKSKHFHDYEHHDYYSLSVRNHKNKHESAEQHNMESLRPLGKAKK